MSEIGGQAKTGCRLLGKTFPMCKEGFYSMQVTIQNRILSILYGNYFLTIVTIQLTISYHLYGNRS